jgi:hypothetical protein
LTKKQQREEERREKEKEKAQSAANNQAGASSGQSQPQSQPQQDKPPAKVTGNCQYSPDQIPGLMALAENSRGRRQYKEAARKLLAVLACEPGNSKAREELELVRQAEAAEDGSGPQ